QTQMNNPVGLAIDAAGDVFIADTYNNLIREVYAGTGTDGGQIVTIAGLGTSGLGDVASALDAQLNEPFGLSLDSAGDLLIADFGNGRVREVHAGAGVDVLADSSVALGPSTAFPGWGEPVTFTATVTTPDSGVPSSITPTGSVDFVDTTTNT